MARVKEKGRETDELGMKQEWAKTKASEKDRVGAAMKAKPQTEGPRLYHHLLLVHNRIPWPSSARVGTEAQSIPATESRLPDEFRYALSIRISLPTISTKAFAFASSAPWSSSGEVGLGDLSEPVITVGRPQRVGEKVGSLALSRP
nr:hypothetical protein Iba_chr03cCG3020 [Ipomoea batatas]